MTALVAVQLRGPVAPVIEVANAPVVDSAQVERFSRAGRGAATEQYRGSYGHAIAPSGAAAVRDASWQYEAIYGSRATAKAAPVPDAAAATFQYRGAYDRTASAAAAGSRSTASAQYQSAYGAAGSASRAAAGTTSEQYRAAYGAGFGRNDADAVKDASNQYSEVYGSETC